MESPLLGTQLLVGGLWWLWQPGSWGWGHGQDAEMVFHQVFPLAAGGEALVLRRQRRADSGRVLQELQRGSRACAGALSPLSSCWSCSGLGSSPSLPSSACSPRPWSHSTGKPPRQHPQPGAAAPRRRQWESSERARPGSWGAQGEWGWGLDPPPRNQL